MDVSVSRSTTMNDKTHYSLIAVIASEINHGGTSFHFEKTDGAVAKVVTFFDYFLARPCM